MALVYADRVKETTTTTGTGTVNLAGAATGYRTFVSGVGSTNTCYYCIAGGSEWEVGLGTVTSGSPDTLSRTTVLASSNAGALVTFSAGTKDVFLTMPASKIELDTVTVTGTTQTIVASTAYIANNASLVTFTLPSSASVGDTFEVIGLGAGGWKIAQNASQQIVCGDQITVAGVTGFISSTNKYDRVEVNCIATNTFAVTHFVGNITIAIS